MTNSPVEQVVEPKAYVFVYGTLKSGQSAADMMTYYGKLIDPNVKTAESFTMYNLGGFPAVVHGGTTAIRGELYEEPMFAIRGSLDRYEGFIEGSNYAGGFKRELVDIEGYGEVYMYVQHSDISDYPVVESGEWSRYDY